MLENPIILAALICFLLGLVLSGCTSPSRFHYSISRTANHFPCELRSYLPTGDVTMLAFISRCIDSRLRCFTWGVCGSLRTPSRAASPGWRSHFMELSELAERQHCRPYFPVGCSGVWDRPGSGAWPCYAAERFPSSGACTRRFHKIPSARVGRPDCNHRLRVFGAGCGPELSN